MKWKEKERKRTRCHCCGGQSPDGSDSQRLQFDRSGGQSSGHCLEWLKYGHWDDLQGSSIRAISTWQTAGLVPIWPFLPLLRSHLFLKLLDFGFGFVLVLGLVFDFGLLFGLVVVLVFELVFVLLRSPGFGFGSSFGVLVPTPSGLPLSSGLLRLCLVATSAGPQ